MSEAIQKNAAVEVFQVENGFLVKLPHNYARGDFQPIEQSLVFQSFAALYGWMADHFSHRDKAVKNDA